MKKSLLLLILILGMAGGSALISCSKDGGGGDAGSKKAASSGGGSGPTCKYVGIGNYTPTFHGCDDGSEYAMVCKNSATGYECTCKKDKQDVKTQQVDGTPFERVKDIPQLKKNAETAINKLCGFNLTLKI